MAKACAAGYSGVRLGGAFERAGKPGRVGARQGRLAGGWLPLARPHDALCEIAHLAAELGEAGADESQHGRSRKGRPLPCDGQVVCESAHAQEEVRLPRGRLEQECARIANRRLEGREPDLGEASGPCALRCAAGHLAGKGPGRRVHDRGSICLRRAAPDPVWKIPQVVAGRARHAYQVPPTLLEDGVRRPAVVPENLSCGSDDGGDRQDQSARVRADENIDVFLGQEPPHVLPRDTRAAPVVENDQVRRGSVPGSPHVVDPELQTVACLLALPLKRAAEGQRRADQHPPTRRDLAPSARSKLASGAWRSRAHGDGADGDRHPMPPRPPVFRAAR